jgi:hypothetical protein
MDDRESMADSAREKLPIRVIDACLREASGASIRKDRRLPGCSDLAQSGK